MAETPVKTIAQLWGLGAPAVMATSPNKLTPVKTTNDSLLVGVELEIENLGMGYGWYQERVAPFWNVVEDGSLRPRGHSWEFVSRPAPLGLALAEIEHLFKQLKITRKNYTDRTSVHVHTNVQDFTAENLSALTIVYPVFEEVLFQFINQFKKEEEQGYCRDTNLYCIPWSSCRMNKSMVDKIITNPDAIRFWQKYTAVNLLPIRGQGTVEWRHLHGTCDMEKITIWMNIIGAIMRYCKEKPFEAILKTIKELNDVSHYQQFFRDVLRDTLPYSEEYRRPMAEGVVSAKYGLMDFELPKDKKIKKSIYDRFAIHDEDDHPLAHEERVEIRLDPPPDEFANWVEDQERRQAMMQIADDMARRQAAARGAAPIQNPAIAAAPLDAEWFRPIPRAVGAQPAPRPAPVVRPARRR